MRQWKTLPKKTDNAEVIGQPSHDDSEGTMRISTEDSTWGLENCPKSYLNTRQTRWRNQERLQVQSSASKSANSGHQLMAQARTRLASNTKQGRFLNLPRSNGRSQTRSREPVTLRVSWVNSLGMSRLSSMNPSS